MYGQYSAVHSKLQAAMEDDNMAGNSNDSGPRENMIATAVKFLQNPKVTDSAPSQKRAFLDKKGLTKEEIDAAFARAGVSEQVVPVGPPGAGMAPQVAYPQGMPMGAVPMPVADPESRWSKFRDYAATAIVLGGLSYGIYYVYKKYLMPLWYGPSQEEKHLRAIEKSIVDLQQNIQETLSCIKDLQISASSQQRQNDNMTATAVPQHSEVDRQFVNEVKDEIKSLKGLLLSRKQFPPTPVSQPVLPAWQLAPKSDDDANSGMSATVSAGGVPLEPLQEVLNSEETSDLPLAENSAGPQVIQNGPEVSHPADSADEPENKDAPLLMNGHLTNGHPNTSEAPINQSAIRDQEMATTSEISAKTQVQAEVLTQDSIVASS